MENEVKTYIDETGELKVYHGGLILRASLTVREMLTLYGMLKTTLQSMDEIPQDDKPPRLHTWLDQSLNEGNGTYRP